MSGLRIDWRDHVALVVLNRPERLNALNAELAEALVAAAESIAKKPACRAVVLHGAGRAFCSGIDVDGLRAAAEGQKPSIDIATSRAGAANIAQQAVLIWRALPIPVIAAIHGVALGAGLQIALGADIRIVEPGAKLAMMEVKWGLAPDMCGVPLLGALTRPDVAADLAFTGRDFDGNEAYRIGVATRLAPHAIEAALCMAREIAALSPDAVRAIKRLLRTHSPSGDALKAEAAEQAALLGQPNQREAVAARLGRRAAVFLDREASE